MGEKIVSKPPQKWHEQEGIIYFTVTSDGATGEEWIKRLEMKGHRLGKYDKRVLRSKDFKPTQGITTKIAVLKGELFEDENRLIKIIRSKASEMQFTTPNAEVACLIHEMFSNKNLEEMDLWWIAVMHEAIEDSARRLRLLGVVRDNDGLWLQTYHDSENSWSSVGGFAFAASQVS